MRSLASRHQLAERKRKLAVADELAGKDVWIDGFNTIITLEVLLSDSLLFSCMDGTVRDLAALRGTYRPIPQTPEAVKLMFDVLQEAFVREVNILKTLIADVAEGHYPFHTDITILKDVDRQLYGKERVITSDSIILDHCISWVNLTDECMKRKGKQGLKVWSAEE